jgi:hypothetical protein
VVIDRDDVLNSDYDFYDVLTLIDKVAELEKEVSIALGMHSNLDCNIKELEKENRELQEYLKELE